MTDRPVLLWLDVETTGLDPTVDDLLQVAAIATDLDGAELAEPFERVIAYHPGLAFRFRNESPAAVREMHEATGLWDRITSAEAKRHDDVDDDLLAYVSSVAPEPRQARVAGSSVRLDMNFLDADLPKTAAHLHYRFVDTRGLGYVLGAWGLVHGEPPVPEGHHKHNAVDDIRASLAEYRWIREQVVA